MFKCMVRSSLKPSVNSNKINIHGRKPSGLFLNYVLPPPHPQPKGGGHTVFGADLVSIGVCINIASVDFCALSSEPVDGF